MTWLWLICFSALAALPLTAGGVSGSILIQTDKGRPRADAGGVVVWLKPMSDSVPPAEPRAVRMLQKEKKFEPHVLAVPVNSTVDFPNLDPIFHNAFSNFSGQIFDVGLYPPGSSRLVKFRREGIVRIFCNIHPTMSAVIAVLRTPWFNVTGPDGRFHFTGVPPGTYRLKLFYERATEETLQRLERDVIVESDVALPPLRLSEAGYLAVPHRNKYGREYPPVTTDIVPYPGVRP